MKKSEPYLKIKNIYI